MSQRCVSTGCTSAPFTVCCRILSAAHKEPSLGVCGCHNDSLWGREWEIRERETSIPRLQAQVELGQWQRSWERQFCQLPSGHWNRSNFQETQLHKSSLEVLSLTSFLAPSWPQSCCLSGRNFECYTKLRGNINTTWFRWNSAQRGSGKLLRARAGWELLKKGELLQFPDLEPQELGG